MNLPRDSERDSGSDPQPPLQYDVPDWCRCTFCRDMPSDIEKVLQADSNELSLETEGNYSQLMCFYTFFQVVPQCMFIEKECMPTVLLIILDHKPTGTDFM
jgi:hypothetical protein